MRFAGRVALLVVAPALAIAAALLTPAAASAAFPGKNGKIAYAHQVGESGSSIYVVNPNGASPTNLSAVGTGTTMNLDFQPAWSATGKQLAFVRVDFQNCSGQIWTMNANGTSQTNVSNDAALANEFNPAWGPDGSIVFVRAPAHTFSICTQTPASQGDLWIREPNGSTRQLTSDGLDNTPAFSPDGKKIAFSRAAAAMPPSGPPHIFVMNASGTGTPKDLGPGLKPNWSPDGKKIVFAAPGQPNGPPGGPVTVMNANGSHRQTLNMNGTVPVWSPDGKQIAYIAFNPSTHTSAIGVMNANGSHQHTVTNPGSGSSDVKPDWQPVLREMRLSVTPRSATAGQRICFTFRASSGGHGVAGATIHFAHRSAVSSASGAATICASLAAGMHVANAAKAGFVQASAAVRARKPSVSPSFTG
jgi:TolB protein